ncbi:SDR family NAD(P)-dependent oxidoreductase [Bacillus sp. Y1]|nr:SDR family oxidoreductase [Bacillus sp. Y1]AYA76978.1 SDR family NAD(P)-dependent oxidoreductase [Bacillus sp. Y1]
MNSNDVVMITGASKGLGKALTLAFAKQRKRLSICARNTEALSQVKEEAEQLGAEVFAIKADISLQRDVERFVALTVERYGQIDVLINNASTLGPSPIPLLLDYPEDDFSTTLHVNVLGPFSITKRVLIHMLLQNKGSVINITSEAGSTGYAGWGAYGVSKFALEGLTETWADELRETNIRINMVDPGEMNTEMHVLAVPDCDYPLADPNDVVDIFLYLASEDSINITGKRFEAQVYKEERK